MKRSKIQQISSAILPSLLIPIPIVAHAEIYLSSDQAAEIIFPGVKFERKEITLTDAQKMAIEKSSGESIRNQKLTAFVEKASNKKNVVLIDQVLGKHEFITIAVGINGQGIVQDIEILEYRESYGNQVKNADWRKQFVGKSKSSPIKLGSDIKNISGATLSSAHVSAGVRRLVQTYEVIHDSL